MTIRKINYTVIAPEVEEEIKDKYTKVETDGLLNEKSDKTHNHNLNDLSEKSYNSLDNIPSEFNPTQHTHIEGEITDLDKYTKNEVDNKLSQKQNNIGYTPENIANKGIANGYASLDSNTKIPLSQLPDTAKQQTYVINSETERLALSSLIEGDKCFEVSTGDSYIWNGTEWLISAKADWENVNLQWVNVIDKPNSSVSNIDDAVDKKHEHNNLTLLQSITQTLIDRWNSAWEHISDTVKHITSAERTLWNTVSNKAEQSDLDIHTSNDNIHVTTIDKSNWNNKAEISDIPIKVSELDNDSGYINDVSNKADLNYVNNQLDTKVDKVIGKQLSTEDYTNVEKTKLAGIETEANKYIHPSTHPASIITENTSKKFVSDIEKTNWNNKWDYDESTIKAVKVDNASNADTVNNKTVAENVPVGAKFTDTTYSEITTSEIDVGTSSTLRTITGRRVKYILDKVQGWISAITKFDIGLGNVDNTSDLDKPTSIATQTALDSKVDNSKVLTDVPLNAKFTDTITTINGKTGAILKSDITALGIPEQDTTYNVVTTTTNGLMIAVDKVKLNGIESGANNYTHPSTHSLSMITETTTEKKMTSDERNKLVNIEENANNYVHPTTSGNKHIPSGGATGQFLKWQSDGTAIWDNVPGGLELGETSGTAYRGDRGKIAYDHSQTTHAPSNANYYEHPSSHSASIITEDATRRFVSDSEKSNWNNKQDVLGYTPVNKAGDIMTGDLKVDGTTISANKLAIGYSSSNAERFRFEYNGSTGHLELWANSSDSGTWVKKVEFPKRQDDNDYSLLLGGELVATKQYVDDNSGLIVP